MTWAIIRVTYLAVSSFELPLRTRVLGVVVVVAGCVVASLAEGFDPDEPAAVVVGPPPGLAPVERVDEARRGQSPTPLPSAPEQLWRRELAGGLEVSPAVAADGALVAALTSPDLVKLDRSGSQVWRMQLGSAPAASSPVIVSDGSAVVLTDDGELWRVSAGGRLRWRRELGIVAKRTLTAALPRSDGGVIVAGESALVEVGPAGKTRARTNLGAHLVGGILPWRDGVLATGLGGRVVHWRPPSPPRELGELGGQPRGGAVLASERILVAVVDNTSVVAFDLLRGSVTPLLNVVGTPARLEGPVTLDASGVLWVTGFDGALVGLDATGRIAHRGALEPRARLGDAGGTTMGIRRVAHGSPPLLSGPQGRLGFARSSGKVGVVSPKRKTVVADGRFCARPLAVLPGGDGRMIVACRSGSVAAFGDR